MSEHMQYNHHDAAMLSRGNKHTGCRLTVFVSYIYGVETLPVLSILDDRQLE